MNDTRKSESEQDKAYPARKARGAEIILRTRPRQLIFFGGLIAFVVLIFVLSLIGLAGG